jgi:pimeloyl-ACP methyl ester carboxylesterase
MQRWQRVTGVAGIAAGAAAAVAGSALAAEKIAVGRIRLRPDPAATEPFGKLRGRVVPVTAEDGIPLHVEVEGPDDAPITMIFCHGYALNQDCWHFQRRDLSGTPGYRLVFWDQRCHGRSGRCGAEFSKIKQTGSDLHAIIQKVAPGGAPVVLVGHSMGGMTITALADQHPELFGTQVKAVALISTAAAGLRHVTLGLPGPLGTMVRWSVPTVMRGVGEDGPAALVERLRNAGGDLAFLSTRFLAFGHPGVSPALTDFLEQMIRATPIEVISEFFAELVEHDLRRALPVLGKVPTVVISGGRDRLTPPQMLQAIADAVPGSQFLSDPDAGHVIMLEHPDLVTAELRELMRTAAERTEGAPGAASTGAGGSGRAAQRRKAVGKAEGPDRASPAGRRTGGQRGRAPGNTAEPPGRAPAVSRRGDRVTKLRSSRKTPGNTGAA